MKKPKTAQHIRVLNFCFQLKENLIIYLKNREIYFFKFSCNKSDIFLDFTMDILYNYFKKGCRYV